MASLDSSIHKCCYAIIMCFALLYYLWRRPIHLKVSKTPEIYRKHILYILDPDSPERGWRLIQTRLNNWTNLQRSFCRMTCLVFGVKQIQKLKEREEIQWIWSKNSHSVCTSTVWILQVAADVILSCFWSLQCLSSSSFFRFHCRFFCFSLDQSPHFFSSRVLYLVYMNKLSTVAQAEIKKAIIVTVSHECPPWGLSSKQSPPSLFFSSPDSFLRSPRWQSFDFSRVLHSGGRSAFWLHISRFLSRSVGFSADLVG